MIQDECPIMKGCIKNDKRQHHPTQGSDGHGTRLRGTSLRAYGAGAQHEDDGEGRCIQLEVLIESADAVLHAEQVARCTPRMGGLIFGLVDFAGDIGAQELGSEQFFYYNYAKAKCITAARAAGITVVDGITLAIRDDEACRRDAQMGARMGFDGKWAIHPSQIDIINEAYTPTANEIARAKHIIDEYEKADVQKDLVAIVIDDQLVDTGELRVEWHNLAVARRAGLA